MAFDSERYENIIASITTATVSQISGVADLSLDSGATFTGKMFRSQNNSVQVTVTHSMEVIININVKAYYGYKVPDLAYEIQTTVKSKVESSTPYKVKSINVNVIGVVFK